MEHATREPLSYGERFVSGSIVPALLAVPLLGVATHIVSIASGVDTSGFYSMAIFFGSFMIGIPIGLVALLLSALRFRRYAPRKRTAAFLTGMCYLVVLIALYFGGGWLIHRAIQI